MLMVSEQQTFVKLRLAPLDFAKMIDENPEQALQYITQLQGEREKQPQARKTKAAKDPNSPPARRGRSSSALDFSKLG
jgi:hypothetical protein